MTTPLITGLFALVVGSGVYGSLVAGAAAIMMHDGECADPMYDTLMDVDYSGALRKGSIFRPDIFPTPRGSISFQAPRGSISFEAPCGAIPFHAPRASASLQGPRGSVSFAPVSFAPRGSVSFHTPRGSISAASLESRLSSSVFSGRRGSTIINATEYFRRQSVQLASLASPTFACTA